MNRFVTRSTVRLLACGLLIGASWLTASTGRAAVAQLTYDELRTEIQKEQEERRKAHRRGRRSQGREQYDGLETTILTRIGQLFTHWMGTRWGLGMPQTDRPQVGKVNCGMFVALILKHAGFNLPVWKFNRQAATMAIRSIAPRSMIRYLRQPSPTELLRKVEALGPGLFVVGLDYHIGFLRLGPRGLRFIHASFYKERVVDEPAAEALDLLTSRRIVIGKIVQPNMLRSWLTGRRIRIKGRR